MTERQKKNFHKICEEAKKQSFNLPSNVKMHKQLLPNGKWNYVLKHDILGTLGRILIIANGNESQICCELIGEANDPMTAKRRKIFEPLSASIIETMISLAGPGYSEAKPYISPEQPHTVATSVYACQKCNKIRAMIVFAEDVDDVGGLEDYASIMHSKIKELNVETWIIGRETENIVDGEDLRKSLVLKIHPKRQKAKILTPDEIMDQIDMLINNHCNIKKF